MLPVDFVSMVEMRYSQPAGSKAFAAPKINWPHCYFNLNKIFAFHSDMFVTQSFLSNEEEME